ncbi:methyl-accepting chemotaxis protein [Undibacterium terreum]|uniref:Methyl-accepting chemotaxis protein n=2 Tax=Undibacterium terreum TaxID=1224302 RepID=A0A916US93_9BURK|nr:methyl-accepting chemotaxis protein [Undibacterium terreum]
MNFGRMKVSTRLTLGFSLVLTTLLIIVVMSVNRMAKLKNKMDDIVNINDAQVKLASAMYLTTTDRELALRNLILLKEKEEIQAEVDRIKAQSIKYAAAEQKLASMLDGTEERDLFNSIGEQAKLAEPYINRAAETALQEQTDEAFRILRADLRPIQRKWWATINEFTAYEEKHNAKAIADAEQIYTTARALVLAFGSIALMTGIVAAVLITRSLVRQLGGEPQYAVEIAGGIASGDLSMMVKVVDIDRPSLLRAMKEMQESLANIVGQVRIGTETIATASHQIATGNFDLSSRTEQQASSLEETASSLEELTSTVKQNADNARQANQLALSASDVAVKGGKVVAEVVSTMGSISASSKKIFDIISVIDGIAFQTNILALNAAVEAARAGEQGRGFAVVATEVRNLAQRSAAAAKEIKTLIGDSVHKVDAGSQLVDQAGVTMGEIVTSIQQVTDIMAEILAASHEQTVGIEQINEAILQLDDATQQNAALVEEAAAAANSLQGQADNLARLVSTFKIGHLHTGTENVNAVLMQSSVIRIGAKALLPIKVSYEADSTKYPA